MTRTLAVVGCFFVAACSGGTSGGTGGGAGGGSGAGGGGGTITADQACTHFAMANCTKIDSCSPFITSAYFGTVSDCVARAKLSCLPALALPTTGATPAKMDACASAVEQLDCSDTRVVSAPGCTFMGSLAAGKPCGSNAQCVGGYCRLTTATCGVCSTRSGAGGSCTTPDDCASGSTCVGTSCVVLQSSGSACSASKPCKTGLWCQAGTCTAAGKTANAACDSNTPESCDYGQGYFCNMSNVCVKMKLGTAGNSCGLTATDFTDCVAGGVCNTSGGTVGTCVAPAADGASCDTSASVNRFCLFNANCEGGTCKVPDPASCQ